MHNRGSAIGIAKIPYLAAVIVRQKPQETVCGKSVDSPGGFREEPSPLITYLFPGIACPHNAAPLNFNPGEDSSSSFCIQPRAISILRESGPRHARHSLGIYSPADCGETNGASRRFSLAKRTAFAKSRTWKCITSAACTRET